jgi:hypothetical protein
MLMLAILLFALAALAGLAMAVMLFRGAPAPRPVVATVHGACAAAGLLVLLWAVLRAGAGGPIGAALGLFVIAALGGFTLLSFHLRGRALPKGLIAGHALLAVAAFCTLLWAVFARGA